MAREIYVNLPVKDLQRSIDFFTALGFTFNPQFTDKKATCMIIGENIYAMLLIEPFFKTFTSKQIADTSKTIEVIVCINADSRSDIDSMVEKAKTAGGSAPRPPKDHGFMYQHGFEDVDGHVWELVWMDPNAEMPK